MVLARSAGSGDATAKNQRPRTDDE